jgi:hypothetical protein
VNHSTDGGVTWVGVEKIPGGPYEHGWMLATIDAGRDGSIHAQFMGDNSNVYYAYRNPITEEWSPGEVAAYSTGVSLDCATMVVDSEGEVHMAGNQTFGWGSYYGHIGHIKYWHGRSGDWSEPETPFMESSEDSFFASWPTLGINEKDDLFIVYARIDTVIDEDAVSGMFFSTRPAGADHWEPHLNLLTPDEYNCLYPQLVMRCSTEGSIPGPGVVWSELEHGNQPASLYYMWLGSESNLPHVTIEVFNTPTVVKKGETAVWNAWWVNNTDAHHWVDAWLSLSSDVLPPAHNPYIRLLKERIFVPGNYSKGSATIKVTIPDNAPKGYYLVKNLIGDYPDDPIDASSFMVKVTN